MAQFGRVGEFNPDSELWSAYIERIEQFFVANDVREEKKVPILLSVMGAAAYGLLRNLVQPEKPKDKTFGEIFTILQMHFEPEHAIIAERFRFNNCSQKATQSVAQFADELKHCSINCEFGPTLDEALRDRFVSGVRSETCRKRLLSETNLTFTKALEIALRMEAAARHTQQLRNIDVYKDVVQEDNRIIPAEPWVILSQDVSADLSHLGNQLTECFTNSTTLLLIELTRENWDLYNKHKRQFYNKLEELFRQRGYNFSSSKIRKKWGNLLTTYKRAKERCRESGEGRVNWEYFEAIDSLFTQGGTSLLPSSPGSISSTQLFIPSAKMPLQMLSPNPGCSFAQTTEVASCPPPKKIKLRNSPQEVSKQLELQTKWKSAVLDSVFYQEEGKRRQVLEKRCERREVEMLRCLKVMCSTLKEISEKQDKIISLLGNK